ncbi:BON domain-containing protein [Albibacterium indicum]|uniref:BON domain-containing protein n=1 Tax=Albibacterium indicum TaxID=2292082 RepID=UPI000E50F927|nr:BON domain-containing protein [Pedobacter indicus]
MKKFNFFFPVLMMVSLLIFACSSPNKTDVKAQQAIEESLPAGVDVVVEDGVATFSGQFENEVDRIVAENAARKTRGIRSVENNATVLDDTPVDSATMDSLDAIDTAITE